MLGALKIPNVFSHTHEVAVPAPKTFDADSYYQAICEKGLLRTYAHAQQWSAAVLRTLAFNLDRKTRKALAQALPKELRYWVERDYRFDRWRDPQLTAAQFYKQVALRSGNTDACFASIPTKAVLGELKKLISTEMSQRIADSLAPEVRPLWLAA